MDGSQRDPKAKTYVVVGDGITAVSFIENRCFTAGDTLVVIGQAASQLGRGVAYAAAPADAPWRYAYLLNSPADDIDPAFAHWLSDNWDTIEDTMKGRQPNWLEKAYPLVQAGDVYGVNAPREFYGDFVAAQTRGILENLRAQGVIIQTHDDTATAISEHADRLLLSTQGGLSIVADAIDIAPGGPSTLRIDGDDGPFSAPTLFGQEDRIVEHITNGAEVFCIGGNASMLDALRLCQSKLNDKDLRFVACAPDGELPPPLVPRMPRKLTKPELTDNHATADSFLNQVQAAIAAAHADGDEMREIRAGFRAHFLREGLSRYVPDIEEAKRVPATLRFWLRGGTRDTILDMQRLVDDETLQIVKGFAVKIAHDVDHAKVLVRDEDGVETWHKTGFVINCAGAGPNSVFDPLTESLLKQKAIKRCPASKGLSVGPDCMTGLPNVRHLSPACRAGRSLSGRKSHGRYARKSC